MYLEILVDLYAVVRSGAESPYTFPQSLQEATCRVTNRTEALIQSPVCSDPLSVHILSCVCVFPCDFITSIDFCHHCHSQGTGKYPFLAALTSFALPLL